MKKILFAATVASAFALYSCQSATEKSDTTVATKQKTLEDTLYQQVMSIHNEIMPKMGKLKGYQAMAQKQMDSIKAILSHTTFPTEVARRIADDVNKLDVLNDSLKAADQAMNDWMEQFDADPKMPTTEEKAAYFADQKQKAEVMRNRFMTTYKKAEALFATPASGNKQ